MRSHEVSPASTCALTPGSRIEVPAAPMPPANREAGYLLVSTYSCGDHSAMTCRWEKYSQFHTRQGHCYGMHVFEQRYGLNGGKRFTHANLIGVCSHPPVMHFERRKHSFPKRRKFTSRSASMARPALRSSVGILGCTYCRAIEFPPFGIFS